MDGKKISGNKDGAIGWKDKAKDLLIKYDNPIVVAQHERKEKIPKPLATERSTATQPGESEESTITIDHCNASASGLSRKETEEILNSILPPREWQEDGKVWRQMVSCTPATRQDVVVLEDNLRRLISESGAVENGICQIRRNLYKQCFDELIRQITINCAERGLMLLRIRDEIHNTINSYRDIYESAAAFGMRRVLQTDATRTKLETKYHNVSREREELLAEQSDLRKRLENVERLAQEQKEADEKKHFKEVEMHARINNQIRQQIDNIVAPNRPVHTASVVAKTVKLLAKP